MARFLAFLVAKARPNPKEKGGGEILQEIKKETYETPQLEQQELLQDLTAAPCLNYGGDSVPCPI